MNKFTCFAFINSYWLFTACSFILCNRSAVYRPVLMPVFGTCTRCVLCYKPNISLGSTGLCGRFWVNCSQISSPSLVNNNGVRVNREQERRAGRRRWGIWSNPPRPKQLQEGEEGGEPQPAAAAAASQPRFQPAWASRLASLASSDCAAPPLLPPRTPGLLSPCFSSPSPRNHRVLPNPLCPASR